MQTGEGAGGGWGVEIYMMSLVSVGLSYILYKYRSYYERGKVYYNLREEPAIFRLPLCLV